MSSSAFEPLTPVDANTLDDLIESQSTLLEETQASQVSTTSTIIEPGVVYLDDPHPSTKVSSTISKMTVSTTVKTIAKTAAAKKAVKAAEAAQAAKRQRSLVDMFGRAAKKVKLDNSAPGPTIMVRSNSTTAKNPTTLNSIPFSLNAYRGSLTPEERDFLSLECETMGLTWLKVLKDEIRKPYFISLKKFLRDEGVRGADHPCSKVFPAAKDIYSWSRHTPLGKVRVVILGQDPYHGVGQAHGLAFSVQPGVPAPPSLKNIYTELKSNYPDFVPPEHGYLLPWAKAGVLLLNTSLTVHARQAGSHANKGWETFVGEVIKVIDKWGGANLGDAKGKGRGVVFMAWGSWAQKRVASLDTAKHLILSSVHPSPLSAYRGFFGNGHFSKANEWLRERYGQEGEVDWCALHEQPATNGEERTVVDVLKEVFPLELVRKEPVSEAGVEEEQMMEVPSQECPLAEERDGGEMTQNASAATESEAGKATDEESKRN